MKKNETQILGDRVQWTGKVMKIDKIRKKLLENIGKRATTCAPIPKTLQLSEGGQLGASCCANEKKDHTSPDRCPELKDLYEKGVVHWNAETQNLNWSSLDGGGGGLHLTTYKRGKVASYRKQIEDLFQRRSIAILSKCEGRLIDKVLISV
jgi:hypothetical protein